MMMTLGTAICHLAQKAFTLKSLMSDGETTVANKSRRQLSAQADTHGSLTAQGQLHLLLFRVLSFFLGPLPRFSGMKLHRNLPQRVEAPETCHQGLIPLQLQLHLHLLVTSHVFFFFWLFVRHPNSVQPQSVTN